MSSEAKEAFFFSFFKADMDKQSFIRHCAEKKKLLEYINVL